MEHHQFVYSLKSIFGPSLQGNRNAEVSLSSIRFAYYNVYSKYFVFEIKVNTRELPVYCNAAFTPHLHSAIIDTDTRVAISLTPDSYINRGTYDTIIRDFFQRGHRCNMLKCTTGRGEEYYGCPGIILDKDFNPLMIAFYDITPNLGGITGFKITGVTIKVSPKVYSNPTGLLEKAIINKIIPSYAVTTVSSSLDGFDSPGEVTPRIVIEDISKYVVGPSVPSSPATMDRDINNFLARNSQGITSYIE